jgi:hypothetical protein
MLFRTKVSAEKKGEIVGSFLPGLASLAAHELAQRIPQIGNGHYEDGSIELLLELLAFYMHVANRLAFRDLGAEECSHFSTRLIVTVASDVTTSLDKGFSSVQVIAELRDKYNERDQYYAQFRKFVPDSDEPPKDTVFWEFAKVVYFRFVNTDNTADLIWVQEILLPEVGLFLKKTNEILKT